MATLKTKGHKEGFKVGRRPMSLRTPKAEMMDLCVLLHSQGLGCGTIGLLLGYDYSIIHYYMKAADLPAHTPGTIRDAIVRNLPLELRAQCDRVRMRSNIARAKKIGVPTTGYVHLLLDDDDETCCNVGGAVRPEKAVA